MNWSSLPSMPMADLVVGPPNNRLEQLVGRSNNNNNHFSSNKLAQIKFSDYRTHPAILANLPAAAAAATSPKSPLTLTSDARDQIVKRIVIERRELCPFSAAAAAATHSSQEDEEDELDAAAIGLRLVDGPNSPSSCTPVLVQAVIPNSLADRKCVQPGDQLLAVNGHPLLDARQANSLIRRESIGQLRLLIKRSLLLLNTETRPHEPPINRQQLCAAGHAYGAHKLPDQPESKITAAATNDDNITSWRILPKYLEDFHKIKQQQPVSAGHLKQHQLDEAIRLERLTYELDDLVDHYFDENDKINLSYYLNEFESKSCDLSELLTNLLNNLLNKLPNPKIKYKLLNYIKQIYIEPNFNNKPVAIVPAKRRSSTPSPAPLVGILSKHNYNYTSFNGKFKHNNTGSLNGDDDCNKSDCYNEELLLKSKRASNGRLQLDLRLFDTMTRRYLLASRVQQHCSDSSTANTGIDWRDSMFAIRHEGIRRQKSNEIGKFTPSTDSTDASDWLRKRKHHNDNRDNRLHHQMDQLLCSPTPSSSPSLLSLTDHHKCTSDPIGLDPLGEPHCLPTPSSLDCCLDNEYEWRTSKTKKVGSPLTRNLRRHISLLDADGPQLERASNWRRSPSPLNHTETKTSGGRIRTPASTIPQTINPQQLNHSRPLHTYHSLTKATNRLLPKFVDNFSDGKHRQSKQQQKQPSFTSLSSPPSPNNINRRSIYKPRVSSIDSSIDADQRHSRLLDEADFLFSPPAQRLSKNGGLIATETPPSIPNTVEISSNTTLPSLVNSCILMDTNDICSRSSASNSHNLENDYLKSNNNSNNAIIAPGSSNFAYHSSLSGYPANGAPENIQQARSQVKRRQQQQQLLSCQERWSAIGAGEWSQILLQPPENQAPENHYNEHDDDDIATSYPFQRRNSISASLDSFNHSNEEYPHQWQTLPRPAPLDTITNFRRYSSNTSAAYQYLEGHQNSTLSQQQQQRARGTPAAHQQVNSPQPPLHRVDSLAYRPIESGRCSDRVGSYECLGLYGAEVNMSPALEQPRGAGSYVDPSHLNRPSSSRDSGASANLRFGASVRYAPQSSLPDLTSYASYNCNFGRSTRPSMGARLYQRHQQRPFKSLYWAREVDSSQRGGVPLDLIDLPRPSAGVDDERDSVLNTILHSVPVNSRGDRPKVQQLSGPMLLDEDERNFHQLAVANSVMFQPIKNTRCVATFSSDLNVSYTNNSRQDHRLWSPDNQVRPMNATVGDNSGSNINDATATTGYNEAGFQPVDPLYPQPVGERYKGVLNSVAPMDGHYVGHVGSSLDQPESCLPECPQRGSFEIDYIDTRSRRIQFVDAYGPAYIQQQQQQQQHQFPKSPALFRDNSPQTLENCQYAAGQSPTNMLHRLGERVGTSVGNQRFATNVARESRHSSPIELEVFESSASLPLASTSNSIVGTPRRTLNSLNLNSSQQQQVVQSRGAICERDSDSLWQSPPSMNSPQQQQRQQQQQPLLLAPQHQDIDGHDVSYFNLSQQPTTTSTNLVDPSFCRCCSSQSMPCDDVDATIVSRGALFTQASPDFRDNHRQPEPGQERRWKQHLDHFTNHQFVPALAANGPQQEAVYGHQPGVLLETMALPANYGNYLPVSTQLAGVNNSGNRRLNTTIATTATTTTTTSLPSSPIMSGNFNNSANRNVHYESNQPADSKTMSSQRHLRPAHRRAHRSSHHHNHGDHLKRHHQSSIQLGGFHHYHHHHQQQQQQAKMDGQARRILEPTSRRVVGATNELDADKCVRSSEQQMIEPDSEEETDGGLSLVPLQAKGRLTMTVAEQEKGAAYQCGKLRASDLILEVNGTPTANMTHQEIARTIESAYYQDSSSHIEFLIGESVQV